MGVAPGAAVVLLVHLALALAQPSASPVTRLTESPLGHSRPVWSPDGAWVAYVASGDFGETVAICRASDGLPVAEGPGCRRILGGPVWFDEGTRVGWLEEGARWWFLSREGELSSRDLPRPTRAIGCIAGREAGRLVVYAAREAVTYALDGTGDPASLPLAGANSSITEVCPFGETGLLSVDSGEVRLWTAGDGSASLLGPGPDVAEYTRVAPIVGGTRAVLLSRRTTSATPDRVSLVDLATGREDELPFPGSPEAATVAALRVVVLSEGTLWLLRPGGAEPIALTSRTTVDGDPAISPDGTRVVFASSGRDDTNGDGTVSRSDPPNLYVLALPAE